MRDINNRDCCSTFPFIMTKCFEIKSYLASGNCEGKGGTRSQQLHVCVHHKTILEETERNSKDGAKILRQKGFSSDACLLFQI
jgi:hypothetical protein